MKLAEKDRNIFDGTPKDSLGVDPLTRQNILEYSHFLFEYWQKIPEEKRPKMTLGMFCNIVRPIADRVKELLEELKKVKNLNLDFSKHVNKRNDENFKLRNENTHLKELLDEDESEKDVIPIEGAFSAGSKLAGEDELEKEPSALATDSGKPSVADAEQICGCVPKLSGSWKRCLVCHPISSGLSKLSFEEGVDSIQAENSELKNKLTGAEHRIEELETIVKGLEIENSQIKRIKKQSKEVKEFYNKVSEWLTGKDRSFYKG